MTCVEGDPTLNPSSVERVGPNTGVEEDYKLSAADIKATVAHMVAQPSSSVGRGKPAWRVSIGVAVSVPTAGRRYAIVKEKGWDAVVRRAVEAWGRARREGSRVRVADHVTKGWSVPPDRRQVSGVRNKNRGVDTGKVFVGRDPEGVDRMLKIDGSSLAKHWRASETF